MSDLQHAHTVDEAIERRHYNSAHEFSTIQARPA